MSSVMKYKGYYTKVLYNSEDNVLYGTIEGITDLISFEGDSVSELEDAFHEAVEEYIDACKRMGKCPQKAYKGTFNVRISSDLHKKSSEMAAEAGISLNDFVERAICQYVCTIEKQGYVVYNAGSTSRSKFTSIYSERKVVNCQASNDATYFKPDMKCA